LLPRLHLAAVGVAWLIAQTAVGGAILAWRKHPRRVSRDDSSRPQRPVAAMQVTEEALPLVGGARTVVDDDPRWASD
jgi:hypothetical protein